MMEVIQKISLGITDCNVHPRQFFPCFGRRNYFGNMFFYNFFQPAIARIIVCFYSCFWMHNGLGNPIYCFGRKVGQNFQLKKLASISWSMFLTIFHFFCLCHHQNRRSFLTATASLQHFLLAAFRFGINACKIAFIHFSKSRKLIAIISGTHRNTDLLHHVPNWLIAFMSQLSLHLFCRKPLLSRGHKVYRYEPMKERKIRTFHNSLASQCRPGSTVCALKLFNALHPIMRSAITFSASNARLLTVIPKRILAGLLIRKSIDKFYKLHIHDFEAKLVRHSVNYLWFGT